MNAEETIAPPPPRLPAPEANAALDTLVHKHLDMVYAAAWRQVRDPHLAADVTQAVFILLQKKHARFGPGTIVSAWLLRATRYASLTALHQRDRARHHERRAAAMRAEPAAAQTPETAEWAAIIDAALERLGKTDREAIAAAYFEGMSHKEIAGRLGISEPAADKRVQRALARLRKLLERKGLRMSAAGMAGAAAMLAKPAAAPAAVGHAVMASLGGHVPAGVSILTKGTLMMMKAIKAKAAAVLIMAAAGVSLLGTAAYQRVFAQTATEDHMLPRPVAAVSGGAEFANVTELTLNDDGSNTNFLADLDTGKLLTPPAKFQSPFDKPAWIESQGVDLLYESATSTESLIGFGLSIVPCPDTDFDHTTADRVVGQLAASLPGTPALMSVRTVPAVYAIRTREGGVGMLEAVSVEKNPNRVTIRYKLLTTGARDQAVNKLLRRDILPEILKQTQRLLMADGQNMAEVRDATDGFARVMRMFAELKRGSPSGAAISRNASLAEVARVSVNLVPEGNVAQMQVALAEMKKMLQPVMAGIEAEGGAIGP